MCVFECWFGSKSFSVPPGHIQCSALNYTGPFHCSWSRAASRSNAAVLLLSATRWFLHSSFLSTPGSHRNDRLTPLQERAGDSLWAGCWWIRRSVSGRQLPIQRGTATHLPHHPHTQLLPLRNLHEGLLHERHWWVVVFRTRSQKFQPVSVALLPHPALCFTSVDPLSEARSAAQPAEERRQRVQLELSRLLGKALLLLQPELPGQGGPPHKFLRQRSSHTGKRSKNDEYFRFELVTTLHAASFYTGEQHRQHKVWSQCQSEEVRVLCESARQVHWRALGPLEQLRVSVFLNICVDWWNLLYSSYWLAPFCAISRVNKEEVSCQPFSLGQKKWPYH